MSIIICKKYYFMSIGNFGMKTWRKTVAFVSHVFTSIFFIIKLEETKEWLTKMSILTRLEGAQKIAL